MGKYLLRKCAKSKYFMVIVSLFSWQKRYHSWNLWQRLFFVGWVFVYELSDCGFKPHCSHLMIKWFEFPNCMVWQEIEQEMELWNNLWKPMDRGWSYEIAYGNLCGDVRWKYMYVSLFCSSKKNCSISNLAAKFEKWL